VAHERRIARETIARLNAEFDFSKSFQEQIPNTANFDVVLCLLWSRLGSRLGASQRLPDGSPANSGTEYEITHALASQKERHGLPELHVWINQTIPSFQPEPPEVHDERIAQWRALKRFIEQWTKDLEDGSFVGSFTAYRTVTEFQDLFEVRLRKIAERRMALAPGTLAPPPSRHGQRDHLFADWSLLILSMRPFSLGGPPQSAMPLKRSAKRRPTRTIHAVFSSCLGLPVQENLHWPALAFFPS
jgi:hypothetical protein